MSLSVFQVQGNVFVNLSAVTVEKAISLNLMETDLVTTGFQSGVILYAAVPRGKRFIIVITSRNTVHRYYISSPAGYSRVFSLFPGASCHSQFLKLRYFNLINYNLL